MPLSSISPATMAPLLSRRKPRLTYSAVIHNLVGQLTERSPYLHGDENDMSDEDSTPEIALLYRDEVRTGELLGQGNFSNVFEVADLCLRATSSTSGSDAAYMMDQAVKVGSAENEETGSPQGCSEKTTQEPPNIASKRKKKVKGYQTHEQRRLSLRSTARTEDGKCAYAVKCLKPELLENQSPKVFLEAATDLVIEAKYLTRFNHENILKARGLAQGWESAFADGEYDSFFILFDRLEDTLNKRIKKWRHGEFREENTVERKLSWARELASALGYLADRRLLFRDLKPANIGLQRTAGNSLSVKLFDFGFCRELPVIEQARDDMEATTGVQKFSSLSSGETVFLMSGKGTR
jgi:serine/threonine protein kinase